MPLVFSNNIIATPRRLPCAVPRPLVWTSVHRMGYGPIILRPLTLLIKAPERAVKHPDVPRRGCLAAGYI